jgi:hypothetical protein
MRTPNGNHVKAGNELLDWSNLTPIEQQVANCIAGMRVPPSTVYMDGSHEPNYAERKMACEIVAEFITPPEGHVTVMLTEDDARLWNDPTFVLPFTGGPHMRLYAACGTAIGERAHHPSRQREHAMSDQTTEPTSRRLIVIDAEGCPLDDFGRILGAIANEYPDSTIRNTPDGRFEMLVP